MSGWTDECMGNEGRRGGEGGEGKEGRGGDELTLRVMMAMTFVRK